jgi:cell division transport system ATP-binding protein
MGIVFQDFKLLEDMTVAENVAFAMEVLKFSRKEIKNTVPKVLEQVGIAYRANHFPRQLSGGEKQRAAIGRAIINNPPILLADEPTGNLDPDTSWEIMKLLEEINLRGTTMLIATHDRDIVDSMHKRVVTLSRGKIVSDRRGGYSRV